MTKKATLQRCYYRSKGQMLTKNKFVVVFTVNDEEYSISLPNNAWSYMTPPLQFMAYIDTKPSEFKGTSFTPDNDIELPVMWNKDKKQWFLHTQVFQQGQQKLKEATWFNPNGTVWDGGSTKGFGGMSVEPNGGNKGEVKVEE